MWAVQNVLALNTCQAESHSAVAATSTYQTTGEQTELKLHQPSETLACRPLARSSLLAEPLVPRFPMDRKRNSRSRGCLFSWAVYHE